MMQTYENYVVIKTIMKKYGFIIHKKYQYKTKIAYINNQQQIQINKETL